VFTAEAGSVSERRRERLNDNLDHQFARLAQAVAP
jgi:hypothetical protein